MRDKLRSLSAMGAVVLTAGCISVATAGAANAALCEPIGVWPFGGGNYCNYVTPAGTHVECTVAFAMGGHGLGCTLRYANGVVHTCNEGGYGAVDVRGCPRWLP